MNGIDKEDSSEKTESNRHEIWAHVSSATPENEKRKSLTASVWDAAFYASMVGFGETYFIPLLLAIGATSFQIGVYAAVPQLSIAFAQFFSIFLIEKTMARKKIILPVSIAQVLVLGIMILKIASGKFDPYLFIVLSIAYFAANGIGIPAWNSLIGDLTHDENRGSYFGRRNGLSQLVLFGGILIGGCILQHFDNLQTPLTGFFLILLLAAVSRIGSSIALSRHYDVPYIKREGSQFSFWDFIKRSKKSNFASFVFFIASMSLAIQVAAPFFAIYILRDLGFSYIAYTVQLGVFVASQFITMRSWGVFADRFGNRIVLKFTGAIMPLIPILWFFSKEYSWLILVQIISGLAWGGWALSAGNFIFDAVSPPKRARCAAYFNFFNFSGVFIGAMIGAFLIKIAPSVIDTGAMKIEFISPLQFLFLVSAGLRFLVFIVFIPLIREVRPVDAEPTTRETLLLLTHLRAFNGVRLEPFTGRIMKKVKTIIDKTNRKKKNF